MKENFEFGVEISLDTEDDFLKIKETLTRIGIGVSKDGKNTLYQSCHILHKQGRYFLLHFKELFALDGRQSSFNEQDEMRRNMIAKLLSDWELCTINNVDDIDTRYDNAKEAGLRVLKYDEAKNWDLAPKYSIGIRH